VKHRSKIIEIEVAGLQHDGSEEMSRMRAAAEKAIINWGFLG
jgi:hypothetical protein